MESATFFITALTTLAGLVVGVVLGLNGFAQPATPGALGQSPRVKNLIWLFSGLFPIFVADFHKLGLPARFPWYWPFAGYGVAALLGAVGSVGWMVRSITRSVRSFNQQHPSATIDPGELQREYLTYGKARFEERWREQKEAAITAEEQARETTEGERREAAAAEERRLLDLEADKLVARCVHGVFGHLALSEPDRRRAEGPLIDTIIDAILKVVSVHAGSRLELRGSYMAYIPARAADPPPSGTRFLRDMPARYSGYLELRRGGGLPVRNVVLPVAADADCTLPGAPEAVAVMGPAIMNLRQIGFRPKVSKAVQDEIQEFFRAPYFDRMASVTSLLVQDGGAVHGVMNIESSASDLLGSGAAAAQTALARLQTLTALLSVFR